MFSQALAKLNAAAEWEELTEKEQDLYVQLAERVPYLTV